MEKNARMSLYYQSDSHNKLIVINEGKQGELEKFPRSRN